MANISFSIVRCFSFVLLMTSLYSCTNNGVKIDVSKNICKDEYRPHKVKVTLTKSTLGIDTSGSIDSIVILDSTEMIGKIDKVQVEGDNIYIMDKAKAKAVFCYSLNGKLKWKYSRLGRGRGKYKQLGDMQVQNKKVFLLDNTGLKLIQLDTFGLVTKDLPIGKIKYFFPDQFYVDINGHVILYNFDMGDYKYFPYEMVVMDSACKKALSYHFLKSTNPSAKRWDTELSPMYYYSGNNGFNFTKVMNDTIYSYANGTFSRKYVIDFGKYSIPEKVKLKKNYSYDNFNSSSYEGNIERLTENDSIITFMFAKGNSPGYTFIDKQTLQSKSYGMVVFNINKYFQMLLPIGSYHGKIIASIHPMELIRYSQFYKKMNPGLTDGQLDSKFQKEMPLLYGILKKISIHSNPILVFINISKNKIFPDEKI